MALYHFIITTPLVELQLRLFNYPFCQFLVWSEEMQLLGEREVVAWKSKLGNSVTYFQFLVPGDFKEILGN